MRLIDAPMGENDINAKTVGEFLKMLLLRLWEEADGFSGKRPFGNSDWQYQVYASLIKAGYDVGRLDEDGYVEDVDYKKADKLITDAISSIFDDIVPHGRWIMTLYATTSKRNRIISNKKFKCSECGYGNGRKQSNYRPNCGAKMDLEEV